MAFLLRTISYSAEGRQIVRSARIESERLVLGRAADADIVLNELSVAMRHATIEPAGAGRLVVRAASDAPIRIGGRRTAEAEIELTGGGAIGIGPFEIRIAAQEPGSPDIAIEVERAADDEEESDESGFSLASVLPGKRRLAWAFVLAVLALFLAWPISSYLSRPAERSAYSGDFHADRMWISGSLMKGHRGLTGNCNACHVRPFEPVRDTACKACHTRIADHADHGRQSRARPGLSAWGRFQLAVQETFGQDPGRCVDCHTEHEGAQRIPLTPQRFCSDCHADLDRQIPDTRLGDAGNFETSHPEFQPSVLIRWDGERPAMARRSLAGRPREANHLKFPHALHLLPNGGAAQMGRRLAATQGFGSQLECRDCHRPAEDGIRFQPTDMERDCGMCHSLAFERIGGVVRTLRHGDPAQVAADIQAFYRAGLRQRPLGLAADRGRPGEANRQRGAAQQGRAIAGAPLRADQLVHAVFSPGGACFECHLVDRGGAAGYRVRPVAFPTRYLLHGWFDHRPHAAVDRPGGRRLEGSAACLSCHRADASDQASDLLIPDVASCRACHGGETTRLPVASGCAMCHDYHGDEGRPSMLVRQLVRGRRWTTTVVPVHPAPQPPGGR